MISAPLAVKRTQKIYAMLTASSPSSPICKVTNSASLSVCKATYVQCTMFSRNIAAIPTYLKASSSTQMHYAPQV